MAVVTVTGTFLAAIEAGLGAVGDVRQQSAKLRDYTEKFTVTNGDSIGSLYRMLRVPTRGRLCDLFISNATLGAACTMNIGAYHTPDNGGAVISANAFAAALDVNTARAPLTSLGFTNRLRSNAMKSLADELGLTGKIPSHILIVCALAAAAAATGDVVISACMAED